VGSHFRKSFHVLNPGTVGVKTPSLWGNMEKPVWPWQWGCRVTDLREEGKTGCPRASAQPWRLLACILRAVGSHWRF
jgi:hypothetical protein